MAATDPFTPPSPAPVDPDDALSDLEADFESLTAPPDVVIVPEDTPPIGRSWGFDFDGGGFQLRDLRNPVATNDIATLTQWIMKCLRTPQGGPLHPPQYGLPNPDVLLGYAAANAPASALEGDVRDALTFHPRISGVQDFSYTFDPDEEFVTLSFSVVLDDETLVPINTTLAATTIQPRDFADA